MKTILLQSSSKVLYSAIIMILITFQLYGQRNYPPEITCDSVVIYKTADNIDQK